jgi:protein SCO1
MIFLFILFFICVGNNESWGQAVQQNPPELKGVNIEEHLGQKIPLNLAFTNDEGKKVELGQYFNQGKPVILVFAYYSCPNLCTMVLNGVAYAMADLSWIPGKEYQVLTVNIDPSETPEIADSKKKTLLPLTGKAGIESGWRFFVGEESQIKPLTDAIGFHYYYDEKQKEYAHPTAIYVLTSDGTISRYLYGIQFRKQDFRLALLEASEGKIGNTIDKIILYCYHYDPSSKGYVLFAANFMKIGGLLTLLILAVFLGGLWTRERKRKSNKINSQ